MMNFRAEGVSSGVRGARAKSQTANAQQNLVEIDSKKIKGIRESNPSNAVRQVENAIDQDREARVQRGNQAAPINQQRG